MNLYILGFGSFYRYILFTYSTYEFSSAVKNYGPQNYLRLSDSYACRQNELNFKINTSPLGLVGNYLIDTADDDLKFSAFFTHTDIMHNDRFELEFKKGELQISELNSIYDINFNLLTTDNHSFVGSWKGTID